MGIRRPDLTDDDYITAYKNSGGVIRRAAEILGVVPSAVTQRLQRIRSKGGYDYEKDRVGFVTATSTLLGADGNVSLQWVKRDFTKMPPEHLASIIKDALADVEPLRKIPQPKFRGSKDLLTAIPIGDHHVGMFAWREETGADYDVKLAERLLIAGAEHLIDISPAGETCLIVDVGDFLHYDSQRAETPMNRNALDADTRYAAMIRIAVKLKRVLIERALEKYPKVVVEIVAGNHDPVGSLWLAIALGLAYENNERVTIRQSPAKFTYLQHGKVLLGFTHGDSVKLEKLGGIMSADQPTLWGLTKHRYWLTGHIHQRKVIELPGCMVESFRTLAAPDAWAAGAGYRSGRDITSIVYDREHGEVARHRFDVSMLEAAA